MCVERLLRDGSMVATAAGKLSHNVSDKAVTGHLFVRGCFLPSIFFRSFSPPFFPLSALFPYFEVAPYIRLRHFGVALSAGAGENDICNHL